MDFLLLTSPTQHAALDSAVERNPRRLRQWLFDLPIMNVAETVRRLDGRIRPFNEMAMPPDERLKLLEVLHEAFDEILFSYDDLRLSMLPVSPEERRALAQDIMWLYLQLAAGYKIIVRQHFDAGGKGVRDAALLTAVFRAMELLAHALLYAFRAHETPPPLTWLEFHQLFRYARFRNLHRQRLRQIRGYAAVPTVERLYVQTLLLGIADPYHMSGQAVFENYLLLDSVCEAARLGPLEDSPADRPVYRFVCDEDAPPQPCALAGAFPEGAEGGTLDVSGVVARLQRMAEESQGHDALLMKDLAARLGRPRERREARQAADRTIHLAAGLDSIRHFLERPERIASALEAEVHDGIAVMDLDSADAADCNLFACAVRNISARGYLLACPAEGVPAGLVVGDLVGVVDPAREPGTHAHLRMGLVRWAKQAAEADFHLGVELIDGPARPVRLHPLDGSHPTVDGFHFALDREAGHPARLLIPASVPEGEIRLHVQIAGQTHVVRPRRILLATERWRLVTFNLPP